MRNIYAKVNYGLSAIFVRLTAWARGPEVLFAQPDERRLDRRTLRDIGLDRSKT